MKHSLAITDDSFINKLTEKCGVIGVWDRKNHASWLARQSLMALQHRGQESAGIAVYKRSKGIVDYCGMGLITRAIPQRVVKKTGACKLAIAHTRYSTAGTSSISNCQPITLTNKKFSISIAHNGNIPDVTALLGLLKRKPDSYSDTKVIGQLLLEKRRVHSSWMETFKKILPLVKGSYCFTVLTDENKLYAIRDPFGIRPMCIGAIYNDAYIIASESVALDAAGASFMRDIIRGEILCIDSGGNMVSGFFDYPRRQQSCIFEYIYFARADSYLNGVRVKKVRENLGLNLARRISTKGIKPDVIIPVLRSGYHAAKAASYGLNLPLIEAIGVNSYHGRTFIHPLHADRVSSVCGKHTFIPDDIQGKSVMFIDDSAVRLTTSKALVKGLLDAGAKEVHAGFASPPVINPCNLGIDIKSKEELAAARWEKDTLDVLEENIARLIGAKSVTYLPLGQTLLSLGGGLKDYYSYYFGGLHPFMHQQDKLPEKRIKKASQPGIVIFISGSGTNLQKIIDAVKDHTIDARIEAVISSRKDAFGLVRAKKNNIPCYVLEAKGIYKDPKKRGDYSRNLIKLVGKLNPDLCILAGWMVVLNSDFLRYTQERQIPVINLHPALLTEDAKPSIITSRGAIPVVRGAHAIQDAYRQSLPVSGITVHQVLTGGKFDIGPVIVKEEVRLFKSDDLQAFEDRIHQAEYRSLPLAVNRALHVMGSGVDISKGGYKW